MKDSDWLRDRRSLSESPVVCKARVGQRWSRAQAARLASRWSPFQGFHVRKERKRQSRQPINDSASADPAYHTRLLRLFPGWLGADPTPRPFSIQGTGTIGANGNRPCGTNGMVRDEGLLGPASLVRHARPHASCFGVRFVVTSLLSLSPFILYILPQQTT